MTAIVTKVIVAVATALIVGFKPSRAREKITIGKVEYPGPDKKDDKTTSSNESVKVNKNAETSEGINKGRVTSLNT